MDEETLRNLEDVLVYLLEMCNDCAAKKAAAFEDSILTVFQGQEREFCKVGLGLLKRIMDDCPRQIELLLDDDWKDDVWNIDNWTTNKNIFVSIFLIIKNLLDKWSAF